MSSLASSQCPIGFDEYSIPAGTLVTQFEKAVSQYNENVAIEFDGRSFTYHELNARSNVLAHSLRDHYNLLPEQIIAFSIQRPDLSILAILGILKAGGTYLPIDPAYPDERKRYILEDSKAALLLTESDLLSPSFSGQILFIDKEDHFIDKEDHLTEKQHNPPVVNKPEDTCYIIYTSGSTGRPKGVVVEHRGVVNVVAGFAERVSLYPTDRCLQFASFSFDVSVLEIFMTFFSGAALVLVSREIIPDPFQFQHFLVTSRINVAMFPPSFLRNLPTSALTNIRALVTAGEEAVPRATLKLRDDQQYYNGYGPTECSVIATVYAETENINRNVPIGKPLRNIKALILDENQRQVPDGKIGEIYLSGIGLARGYLNNPALTEGKFIFSPFDPGTRLYRTGDMGRWLEDGNIEYLGRIDDQVKIRGFRIELREIESVLQQSGLIQQSAVVVKGTDKRLVTYYVPDPGQINIKRQELYLQQVESWQQLYTDTYSSRAGNVADSLAKKSIDRSIDPTTDSVTEKLPYEEAEFDTRGWIDSFSRKAIPAVQMRLWLDDICQLILSFKPRRVLEIGSGTGMIFYRIAEHIKHYVGSDISAVSIGQMQARIEAKERPYPETMLSVCAAHELDLTSFPPVDLIVLNSVVQYFPAESYLEMVLDRCIQSFQGGKGTIVLGDIRDLRLLPVFKRRLLMEKGKRAYSPNDLNWMVDREVEREKELCIDPEWFFQFPARYPAIKAVSVEWKQADFINELSQYRYTVVLQAGEPQNKWQPEWTDWENANKVQDVLDKMQQVEDFIALKNVPNPRLWKERQMLEGQEHGNSDEDNLMQILAAGRSNGFQCRMLVAADPFRCHLIFERSASDKDLHYRFCDLPSEGTISEREHKWINDPLFHACCEALQKDIRGHLSRLLPQYMMPADWRSVRSLPVTISGKIDRQFLGGLKDQAAQSGVPYVAPRTGMEKMIATIWEELLEVQQVGSEDNFYDLGGHSLKMGQFINRIAKLTGIKISFSDLYNSPILKDVAKRIDNGQSILLPDLCKVTDGDHYPLSATQKGIWLACQLKGHETLYNIPMTVVIKGPIRINVLEQAFDALINRHESLRTVFPMIDGQPFQQVSPFVKAGLEVITPGPAENIDAVITDLFRAHGQIQFDLAQGPLFRISLLILGEERSLLVFTLHHLVTDGTSLQILYDELAMYYHSAGAVEDYHEPVFQYKDYAYWHQKMIESSEGERQRAYWSEKLAEAEPFAFARFMGRSPRPAKDGKLYSCHYDRAFTEGIKRLADNSGCTVFMVLQALLKVLLYKLTGQSTIIVGAALSGRQKAETEKITGLLANTVALCDRVQGGELFRLLLQQVRTTLLESLENQLIPLHQVIGLVQPAHNALFDVMISVDDQQLVSQSDLFSTEEPETNLLRSVYNAAKFNIVFDFNTNREEMELRIVFDANVFDRSFIALTGRYFSNLAHQIFAYPDKAVDHLSLYEGTEPELFDHLGIQPSVFDAAYGLSTTQRDIYLTSSIDPEGKALRLLVYFEIAGAIDPEKWRSAVQQVSDQEDSLRSVLIVKEAEIYQGVKKRMEVAFEYFEASDETDIPALIERYCHTNQDINKPLFLHYLFRINNDRYVGAISAHHLFVDGSSFKLLVERIDEAYHADVPLTKKGHLPYKAYVFDHLAKFDTDSVRQFWATRLANVAPLSYDGALETEDRIFSDKLTIAAAEAASILAYCRRHKIKPHLFFKGIFALLTRYYCNADHDFCIRENLAGRTRQFSAIIGCLSFVFPLLIPQEDDNPVFPDWCRRLQQQRNDAEGHTHLSLSGQSRLIGEEKLSFFYNYEFFTLPNTRLPIGRLEQVYHPMNNQIELRVIEMEGSFQLKSACNQSIFNGKDLLKRILHIARQVLAEDSPIRTLQYLTSEERSLISHFGNAVRTNNATLIENADQSVLALFNRQVMVHPDKIAVVYGSACITYGDLDRRTSALAGWLQNLRCHGQLPAGETVVGVLLDRSEWLAIVPLGFWKAGVAYLPIDPELPRTRIDYLLQDSGTSLLLTKRSLSGLVEGADVKVAMVEDIPAEAIWENAEAILENAEAIPAVGLFKKLEYIPDRLAYIIYTSGTTGNPKGVMIEHRALSNIALAWRKAYRLDSFDPSLLQIASFSFDVFTGDLIRALTNGGKLVICPSALRLDIPLLYELIREQAINILESTPALILPLMDYVREQEKDIRFLKILILGSDACPAPRFAELVNRYAPSMRIINSYGVTEACIDSGFYEGTSDLLPAEVNKAGNTPIGKPLTGYSYYVCNKDRQLLPVGIPGELLIGGAGVARGYAQREDLTGQKFISFEAEDRVYRTGDIVRWLPDGNLAFAGRNDNQVKIRGYRIELAEIEHAFRSHPEVKDALVTVYGSEDGGELIGWYVSRSGLPVNDLGDVLGRRLPVYMVPSHCILLDKLPLTANGKIDRKALPEPDGIIDSRPVYTDLPVTPTETTLLEIWQDVLQRRWIGIHDNFFALGGHSLKAINTIARIFSAFRVNFPLNVFFDNPYISQQAAYIDKQQTLAIERIDPAPIRDTYPLSSAQKGMYLLQQIEGSAIHYNIPVAYLVKGDLDLRQLEKCFTTLIERHEILRTAFVLQDGEPVQLIKSTMPFEIGETTDHTVADPGTLIHQFTRSFDLSEAPLIRAHVYYLTNNRKLFLLDIHHIISDGVSAGILLRELNKLYQGGTLAPLPVQYKDYAVWQHTYFKTAPFERQERYWLDRFSGGLQTTELPMDRARPSRRSFKGKVLSLALPSEKARVLDAMAQATGCTIYQLLLANFYVLLYKYCGNEDIVVGMPAAARTRPELDNLPGIFVNTLPLRAFPSGNKTLEEFIQEVRVICVEALQNQDYPFEMLIDKLGLRYTQSRHPLTDIFFSFIHQEEKESRIGDAILEPLRGLNDTAKFDLVLHGMRSATSLECSLEYSTDLFSDLTASRLLEHFHALLMEVDSNLTKKIAAIDILSPAEEARILKMGDNTVASYPENDCIHHIFERKAAKFPERTALVWERKHISYQELDAKANLVANRIRGILPDAINPVIAVLLERGPDMISALLGILKAGGAYLPIDPAYPENRISYMLQDSNSAILITHSAIASPDGFAGNRVDIGETELTFTGNVYLPVNGNDHFPVSVKADDLAYIIYTSGSTGKPKGVMVEHRQVVRLFFNDRDLFDFTHNDTWTLFHSYCFDFSVWEMYGALLFGGKLVIIPGSMAQNPATFLQLLKEQQVTVLNQTPGSFYNIIDEEMEQAAGRSGSLSLVKDRQESPGDPAKDLALRYVIFGGEALKPGKLRSWKQRYPACRLINMYGITETTVHVTYKEISLLEIESNVSNIGKPIPTLSLLVMDKDGRMAPSGVAGELMVGGAGLARGYLNRPELTKDRFIDHPWIAGKRLYKTGDLAKMLPNGDFEYLGRIDHQVKIRGYRIELGEIENRLLQHSNIMDVLVIDREGDAGSRYLCAYIVADQKLNATNIKKHLLASLPDYMLPSFFILLDKFPLSPNGKIDRGRLPLPDPAGLSETPYEPPQTPTEQQLAAIWMEVLQVSGIGRNDHFFELGGQSLKAARLATLVHKQFQVAISVKTIFSSPCLDELARFIDTAAKAVFHPIEQAPVMPAYPVAGPVKRLFILNQIDPSGLSYNMPVVYRLEGAIDMDRFRLAIETIAARHEILRSSFVIEKQEVVQVISDNPIPDWSFQEVGNVSPQELAHDFVRPFDLSKAPLWRVKLIKTSAGHTYFLFDIHHIIADDIAADNFVRELAAIYSGQNLDALRIQYKDFALWQADWLQSPQAGAQRQFWISLYQEPVTPLDIPGDFIRPRIKSYEGGQFHFRIDRPVSEAIKALGLREGATPFMVMLAAYTILLARYSGQQDIVIGIPLAGRTHTDLHDLIGMFVNTIPLRSRPLPEMCFASYVQHVKEIFLKAQENQDYPFEELIDQLNIKRDTARNPLFDHMFTYRSNSRQELKIADLHLQRIKIDLPMAKMDIAVEVTEAAEGSMSVMMEYAATIFSPRTIEAMGAHFVHILEQVATNADITLADIELVTDKERIGLFKPNFLSEAIPGAFDPMHIFDVFEQHVHRYPQHIALEAGDEKLTYQELYNKVLRLALVLKARGCGPERIAGICSDRSAELVIGILAILHTGAAYLPLDIDYPAERIQYMVRDSKALLVLTQQKHIRKLALEQDVVLLDEIPPVTDGMVEGSSAQRTEERWRERSPHDLAYIIYTSGSTGKPKGVQIEHQSLYNTLTAVNQVFNGGLSINDTVMCSSSISFDASVMEIFLPFLAGAKLVMMERSKIYDLQALARELTNKKITCCFLPPSLLRPIYDVLKDSGPLFLNKLIVGAEPVKEDILADLSGLMKDIRIINCYGPTEAAIACTCYPYQPGNDKWANLPIGKPLHGMSIYIVNEHLKLQPVGVPGEICVAGIGLARGYLDNPELTRKVFVDNPFEPGKKMYRTGDLARWLPDGNIEFIGRIDHQVKINGLRIEPGEIESRLMTHSDIRQVLVLPGTDKTGHQYLCAYYVSHRELSSAELRQFLANELPPYMIPSFFVKLKEFPLTSNEKVDRNALPDPVTDKPLSGGNGEQPENGMEKQVLSIWQTVLGLEKIGVTDNFFEIGGNSLKVINMFRMLQQSMGDKIKVNDLFDKPTIRQQAAVLSQSGVPVTKRPSAKRRVEF